MQISGRVKRALTGHGGWELPGKFNHGSILGGNPCPADRRIGFLLPL